MVHDKYSEFTVFYIFIKFREKNVHEIYILLLS